MKTRRLRFAVMMGVLLLLIFPIPKVVIQQWSIRVLDENGVPVSGIRVSESWDNYTFGLSGGSSLYTSVDGRVVFPRQRHFGPVAYWVTKATANIVTFGIHAGFGSIGRVWISDPKPKEVTSVNCGGSRCTDDKLESELRLSWH
jgi:hypothetical protein